MTHLILNGDCLDELRSIADASVDSVVTDPPYGLSNTKPAQVAETITRWASGERDYLPGGRGFMGKEWDGFVPPPAVWDECMRILKPGGHMLVFAGSRTQDLMGLSIRLAGFDIRDSVAWLYGSGFPKGQSISKAIDKQAGVTRQVVGTAKGARNGNGENVDYGAFASAADGTYAVTESGSDEARKWEGWNTSLKPAHEPIIMARKPFSGTVASNVMEHGTGALNIDACRVGMSDAERSVVDHRSGVSENRNSIFGVGQRPEDGVWKSSPAGRWPANVLLDPDAAAAMDEQSGWSKSSSATRRNTAEAHNKTGSMGKSSGDWETRGHADAGGASRFFPVFKYQAKAPAKERPQHTAEDGRVVKHATVKPLDLMRWLVRLVTPEGGVVLDPFAGSGATVEAALLEGMCPIGIEREADYIPLIEARIARTLKETP